MTSPSAPSGGIFVALSGAFAIAAGIGIGRFIYTPILPPMMEALSLSKADAGLIASANFAGYLCGAIVAAAARLPGSRRGWLLGAMLASALTTAGMGLAAGMPGFLALRFAGGLASALVMILASALVLETLGRAGRGGLAALFFSGGGIGITASAGMVAALLHAGYGWTALWFAGGALSLLAIFAVMPLISVPPPPPVGGPVPAVAEAGQVGGPMARLVGAYFLFGFGYVITATFMVAIVRGTPAIQPLEPVIWIVVGIAATPSVALWSWLARRFDTSTGFALAAITEAVGVMASVAWPSMIGIIVAAVLLGGTFMGLVALGLIRARELAVGDPRRAIACVTGAFGIGQIIGPVFAGVLADRLGDLSAASYSAAAGLVIAAVLVRR